MTSTRSAAATGLPTDRRTLLGRAAIASLAAATAAVPAIAAERPGGPIEQAYAIWLRASHAADAAYEATYNAKQRYEEPERPRYNHWRDHGAYDIAHTNPERSKGISYCNTSDANIAELKAKIARPFDQSQSDPDSIEWDQQNNARWKSEANATLEKIEAYRAECQRRADACGLTAAREHEQPLADAERNARHALCSLKPSTFREAAFLAALLSIEWNSGAIFVLVDALPEIAGIPAYDAEG